MHGHRVVVANLQERVLKRAPLAPVARLDRLIAEFAQTGAELLTSALASVGQRNAASEDDRHGGAAVERHVVAGDALYLGLGHALNQERLTAVEPDGVRLAAVHVSGGHHHQALVFDHRLLDSGGAEQGLADGEVGVHHVSAAEEQHACVSARVGLHVGHKLLGEGVAAVVPHDLVRRGSSGHLFGVVARQLLQGEQVAVGAVAHRLRQGDVAGDAREAAVPVLLHRRQLLEVANDQQEPALAGGSFHHRVGDVVTHHAVLINDESAATGQQGAQRITGLGRGFVLFLVFELDLGEADGAGDGLGFDLQRGQLLGQHLGGHVAGRACLDLDACQTQLADDFHDGERLAVARATFQAEVAVAGFKACHDGIDSSGLAVV